MDPESHRRISPEEEKVAIKKYEELQMGDVVVLEGVNDVEPKYDNVRAKVVYISGGNEEAELTVGLEILEGEYKGRVTELWKPRWRVVARM